MEMTDGLPRAVVERAVAIVPVREMDRSVAFYEGLGFAVSRYPGGGYAFATRDEVELHLREAADEAVSGGGVYLYVSDADELYEEWLGSGVRMEGEPRDMEWRMREFAVRDPDGTVLRVGHRLPR